MSNSRPIHNLHREIRSTPDEAEPTFSFERDSFLASPELEKEDEFHRRLQQTTYRGGGGGGGNNSSSNVGGGSFWRSSSAESSQPLFTSAVQHNSIGSNIIQNGDVSEVKKNKSTGLLSAALLDGSKNSVENGNITVGPRYIVNQLDFVILFLIDVCFFTAISKHSDSKS
jgi:hypothetical protein